MNHCPSCGAPNDPAARFCNHCGGQIPVAPVASFGAPPAYGAGAFGQPAGAAPPGSIRVCPGCGVVAPIARTSCSVCNHTWGSQPLIVPARADDRYWACIVECDFECRGCGFRSPLDSLDIDGEVECRKCGLPQKFEVDQWKEVLYTAQNVADTAGPPGRRPPCETPYAMIGVDKTTVEHQLSGFVMDGQGMRSRTLRLKVAPGHPLDPQTKQPLPCELDERGNAYVQTSTERAVYTLPPDCEDVNVDIAAILADDHRIDRQPVRVAGGAGAIAINCPTCNAALPVQQLDSLVTCPYCRNPARIPSGTLFKLGAAPKSRPWWILFEDESYLRLGIDPNADDDDDDDDDDEHDHHHHHGGSRLAEAQAAIARQEAMNAARQAPAAKSQAMTLAIVGGVLGLVAVSAVVFVVMARATTAGTSSSADPPTETTGKKKSAAATGDDDDKPAKAAPEKPKPKKLARADFQDLKGCTCTMEGGKKAQLAIHLDGESVGMVVGE
ncbi:MAG: zinc ribbon domain-containing protein, partial [Myxococcales bacterium]|nr:zinc ribbon domain-containing protein [Myxococcales bacterium]